MQHYQGVDSRFPLTVNGPLATLLVVAYQLNLGGTAALAFIQTHIVNLNIQLALSEIERNASS